MHITESKEGAITILHLAGRLDASRAPAAGQRIDAAIDAGARQLVLDLAGIEYISSAGLRLLLTTAKRVQHVHGRLVLAAPSAQARQILIMAGFPAIVPVADSIAQACARFTPAEPPPAPANACHLNLAEEIYLFALDDGAGAVRPMPAFALDYALAGALLMDLALANLVDNDLKTLQVTAAGATGDPLLDATLDQLRGQPEPQPVSFWLRQLADQSKRIVDEVLASLIRKGVLRQESRRILWVFEVRRYPVVDDREVKEVRTRLRELILSDDIPAPRDIVLINLTQTCRLLEELFTADEYHQVKPRIDALARLDLIGHEMSETIRHIEAAMACVVIPKM
jgi:anti-anti-sigma factor